MVLLRYFIPFLIIIAIIGIVLWRQYNKTIDSEPKTRHSESNYAKAIRQLDQIMTDPTLIGSPEWKENTGKVLKTHYGKN